MEKEDLFGGENAYRTAFFFLYKLCTGMCSNSINSGRSGSVTNNIGNDMSIITCVFTSNAC